MAGSEAAATADNPYKAASAAEKPESTAIDALPTLLLLTALAKRAIAYAHNLMRRSAGTVARLRLAVHRRRAQAATGTTAARTFRPRRGLVIAAAVFAIPAAYLAYCLATIPFAGGAAVQAAPSAMVFAGDDGQPFATRGVVKGHAITAQHLPPLLVKAVVAIEDRRFYEHGGIDLHAIVRAAWNDATGHNLQGASTITQQLARRLYLTPDRTFKRKVQEAVLAEWLDLRYSKNEILARYLNAAYFGDGAYGADSAAQRYFGKTAQQLSLGEAALLAGLIKAPSQLDPDRNPAGAQQRASEVLDAMVHSGTITQQQADVTRREPAVVRSAAQTPPGANYFLDTAAAEVKARANQTTDDLIVATTLDPLVQRIAERVVARHLAVAGKAKNIQQAALVAMRPDGAILAMVGGRNYDQSQFNRVTQARRQPGSLFKAFVYLTALRKGYTPDSVMVDRPVRIGDWEPDNYGDHYLGPVTLRTAFAHSLNSVAVQLGQAVGIQNVIDTAKQFGVRSEIPAVPSVALGSGAVTPLEMTRAFAAIATNTVGGESYTVRSISNDGKVVYTRPVAATTAIDNPTIHAEMLDLLSSVVRGGTGTAARQDRPVGGKTGTSEDYRDAWFVGFTSDLVVGVWVGNDDNSPMNGVVGGSVPAAIWHDFVGAAEPRVQASDAPGPAAISFNDAGEAAGNNFSNNGNSNRFPFGGRRPFRLFWFRF
ncbi:MAG: PBP1A family penicillin-binding protein [Xanthobacteraceae bacterium]